MQRWLWYDWVMGSPLFRVWGLGELGMIWLWVLLNLRGGGYIGIMEQKMETLGPFKGISRDYIGYGFS